MARVESSVLDGVGERRFAVVAQNGGGGSLGGFELRAQGKFAFDDRQDVPSDSCVERDASFGGRHDVAFEVPAHCVEEVTR